jgi:hypothetical protein
MVTFDSSPEPLEPLGFEAQSLWEVDMQARRHRKSSDGPVPGYLKSKEGPYEPVRFSADLRAAEAILEGRGTNEGTTSGGQRASLAGLEAAELVEVPSHAGLSDPAAAA